VWDREFQHDRRNEAPEVRGRARQAASREVQRPGPTGGLEMSFTIAVLVTLGAIIAGMARLLAEFNSAAEQIMHEEAER